ncbi:hypothetical protein AYK20_09385 [Thermoplasmatales archaeon SG8-52-1]|nr:MAG: hypothetical protein AYK20_09385 [Thermoplasmatales archaeon SG8-52-1]
MKKLLILGVIALFIGLAFIPSFNAVSISKDIEKINTVVDNTKEDCFERMIDLYVKFYGIYMRDILL